MSEKAEKKGINFTLRGKDFRKLLGKPRYNFTDSIFLENDAPHRYFRQGQ